MPGPAKKATRQTKPRQKVPREPEEETNGSVDCGPGAPEGYDAEEDLLKMVIPPPPQQLMKNADGSTRERLMISHLVVENFKSYFGTQVIGPFHKNFTAIIGPNGSGKSNVIDALLFVFGYRASKIRSKKLSVLIHSSSGRDTIPSCTVAVHFQRVIDISRHEYKVVEGSQFFVSRTAHRDNTSKYSMNGKTTNFKEISSILLETGIDLIHNRFLILQGEVEQISLMKPKAENENEEGMLEYLEDIIGSSRLKLPISKLLYKLDAMQEQRSCQLLRVKYAEKERVALVEPVKELIVKLRFETGISVVKNKLICAQRLKCSDKIASFQAKLAEATEDLRSAKDQMTEFGEKNTKLKKARKDLQKLLDSCQLALSNAQVELSNQKQNLVKDQADIARLEKRQKKISDNISKQESQIGNLEDLPENANCNIEKHKLVLEEAEAAIKENSELIQQKLDSIEGKTAELRQKREKLETELSKHSVVEDEVNSKLALAQAEMGNLQTDEDAQHRLLAELNDNLAELKKKLANKIKELEHAEMTLPKRIEELERIKTSIVQFYQKESVLNNEIQEIRADLAKARQAADEFKGSDKLLQALMKQKQQGNIDGIFGRLGDLGAVDEKYDVAISTTCGALDNIVVDTVETAQQCIEYLKKEKLGIASFIALDKQGDLIPHMQAKPKTPENALRLFDLIRVTDEQVLPAFYYALADTLVADDIVSATRIAMPSDGSRWRTVTLSGEIVETSGAMTGGGNVQRKGKIGRSVKVNTKNSKEANAVLKDIGLLTQRLFDCENKFTEVRQQLVKAEGDSRGKQIDITRAQDLCRNSKLDLEGLERSVGLVEKQVEVQAGRKRDSTVNPVDLMEVKWKVKDLKAESAKITKVTDDLRMQFVLLTEQINSVENSILGDVKNQLRLAEERKLEAEKAIVTEKSSVAANQRNLTKAQRCRADLDADLEKVTGSIDQLKEKLTLTEEKIEELNEVVSSREQEIKKAEDDFKVAMEEGQGLNDEELELQKQIKELTEHRGNIEAKMEGLVEKKEDLKKQISKLTFFNLKELNGLPEEVQGIDYTDKVLRAVLIDVFAENNEADTADREVDDNDSGRESDGDDHDGSRHSEDEDDRHTQLTQLPAIENLPKYTIEEVREFDVELLERQLAKLEERLTSQKDKDVNMETLKDYNEKVKRYNNESELFRTISKQRDLHRDFCDDLRRLRLNEFMEGYRRVSKALKDMYQMITQGGDASLDLVDSLDPFSEGISFGVRPPKKSWKQIVNLSGGEKTLASLAFVFGLHQYRPTPLYVMDEIDAALDFRNVSIISSYILERTKNAQFVVISLRNNMFERGDRIVGIYKVHDCTHNTVLDPKAAEEKSKENIKAIRDSKRTGVTRRNPRPLPLELEDEDSGKENSDVLVTDESSRVSSATPILHIDKHAAAPAKRRLFDGTPTPTRKKGNFNPFATDL